MKIDLSYLYLASTGIDGALYDGYGVRRDNMNKFV